MQAIHSVEIKVRISPIIANQARALAAREGNTLSEVIRTALRRELRAADGNPHLCVKPASHLGPESNPFDQFDEPAEQSAPTISLQGDR